MLVGMITQCPDGLPKVPNSILEGQGQISIIIPPDRFSKPPPLREYCAFFENGTLPLNYFFFIVNLLK